MGAVAVTLKKNAVIEHEKTIEAVCTFSSSYATGGDTVSILTDLGMTEVNRISLTSHRLDGLPISTAQAQTGFSIQLGGTNKAPTLKLFPTTTTEATAASNNSTVAMVVRFHGR